MGITSKGTNQGRRMLAPGRAGVQSEMHDIRTSSPATTFLRAVVTKVLNDPTQLDESIRSDLRDSISNPSFLSRAPRNSVIVRIVSGGQDRKSGSSILCYPFLPPHICMPVKSGEQVFVLFENSTTRGQLPYWMWRAPEPSNVDDVNYTHTDRKFDRSSSLSTSEKLDAASTSTSKVPYFPNGGGSRNSYTLNGAEDFEIIVNEDPAYQNFTSEAVARFTKRPADLALQGSNNTLIVLGEDRTGPAQKNADSIKTGTGTIDIVAGRGFDEGSPTEPRKITNTRGFVEVEKNPEQNGEVDNPLEGDVDFINDKSRVYVSMNTDGDKNFNLTHPTSFGESIIDIDGAPYCVMKSDEIRIISKDGSIRIVKEGTVGADQSGIYLLPEGTVQVDGDIIYLGRTGGAGPGSEGSEPYIKFSKYKSQLTDLIGIIETMLTSYDSAFAVPVAAPGIPHPGLSINALAANATAKAELTILKSKLDEAQSTRIFGE